MTTSIEHTTVGSDPGVEELVDPGLHQVEESATGAHTA